MLRKFLKSDQEESGSRTGGRGLMIFAPLTFCNLMNSFVATVPTENIYYSSMLCVSRRRSNKQQICLLY